MVTWTISPAVAAFSSSLPPSFLPINAFLRYILCDGPSRCVIGEELAVPGQHVPVLLHGEVQLHHLLKGLETPLPWFRLHTDHLVVVAVDRLVIGKGQGAYIRGG